MIVTPCAYADIEHMVARARRETITWPSPSDTLLWWRAGDAGCAALRRRGRWSWRLTTCWVAPWLRGRGFGRLLVDVRLAYARAQGTRSIDVYALRPALFEALGFIARRTYVTRDVTTTHLVWRTPCAQSHC